MGEIRFVGTGETRGYPYLVCKNPFVTPIHNGITCVNMILFAEKVHVCLEGYC